MMYSVIFQIVDIFRCVTAFTFQIQPYINQYQTFKHRINLLNFKLNLLRIKFNYHNFFMILRKI